MPGLCTEQIYEALFDDEAFLRLPYLLADVARARSALLLWQHNDGVTVTLAHTDMPWFADYAQFAHLDPYFAEAVRPQHLNRVILPNEWISSAEFQRSVIYNELVRKHGDDTVYCTGSAFRSPWGNGTVGLHRGRQDRPFDSEDARRLGSVLVHVDRVLRARGELLSARRAAAMAHDALHSLGLAVVVVRSDRRIVETNECADEVLRRGDALALRNGKLVAVRRTDDESLALAISRATSAASPTASAVRIEPAAGGAAYCVSVTPLVGSDGGGRAVLLFRDPSATDESIPARLQALFRLTPAEAEVAAQLAGGSSPADIMERRDVSKNTVSAQLKSIMAKMGCHRQSDVAAVVAALPRLPKR